MKKILFIAVVSGAIFLGWNRLDSKKPITLPSPSDIKSAISFNKSKLPTDEADSLWVVVNKKLPINPVQYEPTDLVDLDNGQTLRKEAAEALAKLQAVAKDEGHDLTVISGFRSYETQKTVYNREVSTYGQTIADTQSARPGYSEHQTGLAVDVGSDQCNLDDCFGNTDAGKWVAKNAYKFGFIVRYVEGKEDITGYKPEPWHIRYVGSELSEEMHRQDVKTLEEFFGL